MSTTKTTAFARHLQWYFNDYLPGTRGVSPQTVLSYRDTWVLLLRYLVTTERIDLTTLEFAQVQPGCILAFLNYLETERDNCTATRNVRLAAIHAFYRYVAANEPASVALAQQIVAIPFKRTGSRPIDYLDYDDIQTVLTGINRSTLAGRRDYVLLALMFNTGARAQEIIDLRINDLQLVQPYQVKLSGKGRKIRYCPLWKSSAAVLQDYCAERQVASTSAAPLFLNQRGGPLTRFGIRYILAQHCQKAALSRPSMASKRLHPHSMRHSAAVHMLKSGVDLVTISHWLGHASPNTTHRYAVLDMEMKREAIEKAQIPNNNASALGAWRCDKSILAWLEAL